MKKYTKIVATDGTTIRNNETGATFCENSMDIAAQEYRAWLAAGNEPEVVDDPAPEEPAS